MKSSFFKILVLVVASATLLVSCSAVFEAGLSGKVVRQEGTDKVGVSDVMVYAYTSEAQRDSDFAVWTEGTQFTPSSSSGYVARTSTGVDGSFTINKLIWEAKKPVFGKTADYMKLYLIFFHEDYDLAKNANSVTVISDSTNASNVFQLVQLNKEYTNVTVNLYDVAVGTSGADSLLTGESTVKYKVFATQAQADACLEPGNDADSATINGSGTINIAYERDTDPFFKFWVTRSGSKWSQVSQEADGTYPFLSTGVTTEEITDDTYTISLFMKNREFVMPAFSGKIGPRNTAIESLSNDLKVWLAYDDGTGKLVPYSESCAMVYTETAVVSDSSSSIISQHGQFSALGRGSDTITWTYSGSDSSYTSNVAEQEVFLIFDTGATADTVDSTDNCFSYTVRSSDGAAIDLGYLRIFEIVASVEQKNIAFDTVTSLGKTL